MSSASADNAFAQLNALLACDPTNLSLIADTAEAAWTSRNFEAVAPLLARYAAVDPLPGALCNLSGLAAMACAQWEEAATIFKRLVETDGNVPPLRFNLAWSLAMADRKSEALSLLDDAVTAEIPDAAQLKIGLLHEQGDLDAAVDLARLALERFPEHRGVNATISTLAIDIDDIDLARQTALRAGSHPDALTTLATLALENDDMAEAGRLFDAVLEQNSRLPRAWVGRGLVALGKGEKASAAVDLDKGAALFESHLGSWIAAGWAHLLNGDTQTARMRFERALAIDDSFAEAQGSLAIVSLAEGDIAQARSRTEIALRLDRQSFAGALAAATLAAGAGDDDKARRIVTLALDTPIDGQGRTIAQALARAAVRQ